MTLLGRIQAHGSEEAAFECNDCKTLQCVRCEVELHHQEHLRNHDRVPVGPGHVPYCDNCKETYPQWE
ncbi:Zinc finger FYVE domain-containing protein 1 [Ilyodon furcidens]|uniref:Zinc finger FYVE domain-containing protein 1 n=1 Tax=Ilyodon furcidens TaxID=33524 RepID=A0ABV0SKV6_9TELE